MGGTGYNIRGLDVQRLTPWPNVAVHSRIEFAERLLCKASREAWKPMKALAEPDAQNDHRLDCQPKELAAGSGWVRAVLAEGAKGWPAVGSMIA